MITTREYAEVLFWVLLISAFLVSVQANLDITVNQRCVAWNNFNAEHEMRCDITEPKTEGRIDILRGGINGK